MNIPMKRRAAFTLIEVLITIIICGVIVTSLTQLIQNSLGIARRVRMTIEADRNAGVLFDQLMRDISAAYRGKPYERRPPGYVLRNTRLINAGDKARTIGKEDFMSTEELSEHKAPYPFFTAKVQETDEIYRVEGERREMLESVNFITTYPFEVYDSYKKYFVRVAYVLSRDDRSTVNGKDTYTLYRKETMDVFNTKLSDPEEGDRASWDKKVYTYRIAHNIKHISFKFSAPEPKKKEEKKEAEKEPVSPSSSKQQPKEIIAFEWGEDEKTKKIMPHKCHVHVALWDKARERFYTYALMIPIFAREFTESDDKPRSSKSDQQKKQAPQIQGSTHADTTSTHTT